VSRTTAHIAPNRQRGRGNNGLRKNLACDNYLGIEKHMIREIFPLLDVLGQQLLRRLAFTRFGLVILNNLHPR
jgi:hypothetical protein